MKVCVTGACGLRRLEPRATSSRAPRRRGRSRPAHAELDVTDAAPCARGRRRAARRDRARRDLERPRRAAVATAGARGPATSSATRNVVDAATAPHVVLISTDWVFDGTQGPAAEDEPPNPINAYGFLKAASELVVTAARARGTVARIAGVQGVHRARPDDAARAGRGLRLLRRLASSTRCAPAARSPSGTRPGINALATPMLATDAAELIWRALEREVTGTCTACGAEHIDRVGAGAPRRRALRARPGAARRRRRRPRPLGGAHPARHAPRRHPHRRRARRRAARRRPSCWRASHGAST